MLLLLRRKAYLQAKMHKTPCSDHFLESVGCGKNCMSLWREAHLQVKMYHVWTIFWKRVEKLQAALARSAFASQNAQSTRCSDYLEVGKWKNCMPLWRKARLHKAHSARSAFASQNVQSADVEKCTSLWRRVHFKVKMLKNGLGPRLEIRMRKITRRCCEKHISKSIC